MRKKLNKLRYSTNTKREKIAALMREYEKGMVNDKFRIISEVLVTKSQFNFSSFSYGHRRTVCFDFSILFFSLLLRRNPALHDHTVVLRGLLKNLLHCRAVAITKKEKKKECEAILLFRRC